MEKKLSVDHADHEALNVPVNTISTNLYVHPTSPALSHQKLLRKVDLHLIPILFLLYICAFVDRINIGNARIQGLESDLRMDGNDYNIALFMFFIPYILLEIPSNLLLQRLRLSIWLSGIMIGWGIITICQGLTQSYAGLVICRVLLGTFESGFFPGCIYLISMYYRRTELQYRVTLFFCSSILAGAFSGLLAYAVANMAGVGGYNGWRWIFIIEGLTTVVVATASFFIIPDWPHQAKFLQPQEKELLLSRLHTDTLEARMDTWDKAAVRRCFSDVKIWIGVVMYMGVVTTGYSGSFFTPTILKQLGWTSVRAQVMSIPIYIAAAGCAMIVAIISDKLKHRFGFIILGCCIATFGYIILLNMNRVPVGARYFALYAITCGGYIAQPITIVFLSNNVSGHYKRAVSSGLQIGVGNIGGIVGEFRAFQSWTELTMTSIEHLFAKRSTYISDWFQHWSWFHLVDCRLILCDVGISETREQNPRLWRKRLQVDRNERGRAE